MKEFDLVMVRRDGTLRASAHPVEALPEMMSFLSRWNDDPGQTLTVMTESGVVTYRHADVARFRLDVPLI